MKSEIGFSNQMDLMALFRVCRGDGFTKYVAPEQQILIWSFECLDWIWIIWAINWGIEWDRLLVGYTVCWCWWILTEKRLQRGKLFDTVLEYDWSAYVFDDLLSG